MINSNSSINTQIKTPSFKGWDASKPLKKIYMGLPSIDFDKFYPVMEELAKIEEKENIKFIYVSEKGIINNASKKILKNPQKFFNETRNLLKKLPHLITFYQWMQDVFTQLPNEKILYQESFNFPNADNEGLNFLGQEIAQQTKHKIYNPNEIYNTNINTVFKLNRNIAGGNIYQGLDKNKKPYVLLGTNCQDTLNKQQLFDIFNTDNIYFVPSADFHLDLFIRPLDKGRILVADDKLSLEFLQNIKKDLQQTPNITKEQIKNFDQFIQKKLTSININNRNKPYTTTEEVCSFLKTKGFEVIRVPGRFFERKPIYLNDDNLIQNANYMNAFVQKRKDNTFGYITNYANPEYTGGININPYFEKYLKQVCPEITDIYFVSGNNRIAEELKISRGAIHCLGAEFTCL